MPQIKKYELINDSNGKKALFTNKKNKSLAVFVHGFTGNYISTWGQLPELLTTDPGLQHFDFLFWGYSSDLLFPKGEFIIDNIRQLLTQFISKHKTSQHIEVVAQGLQTELDYLDDYDNIVLIGHSLGGLVIRSFIIQNLKSYKKKNFARIKKIKQILLFGTPNEGLDLANNKILSSLNNQISDMGSYNEFINSLREEWVELVFKNKNLKFSTLMIAGEDDYFVPFEQVTKYFRDSRELTKGDHLAMVKPISIYDTSYKIIANNLLKVEYSSLSIIQKSLSPVLINRSTGQTKELLEKVRKLIADRGLDDELWSKSISSQYFLVNLARLLQLTKNADYINLLNTFLQSFFMKVDNSIVLAEDKVYITQNEARKQKKHMINEDETDVYYSRYNKLAGKNLDIELLLDNYHYGLVAQLSRPKEFPNSTTLKIIHELAINRLIYGNGKSPTDDHGGWYPQRAPWVTARILISLKYSGYDVRKDNVHITDIASRAIDYLMRSIYKETYWRSGVGEWVSDWESTALCLEALYEWDKIKVHKSKIEPVINYLLNKEKEWLVKPSFDSEQRSNATLAAVTLVCNVLMIRNSQFKKVITVDEDKYLNYLSKVIDAITNVQDPKVGQHNTIPQIAFYITRLILRDNVHRESSSKNYLSSLPIYLSS
jgi:hypothetical protein